MSNDLFTLSQEVINQQGSIFNQLLNDYSHPEKQIINQEKLFSIEQWPEQQIELKNHHKSSGQWVWADDNDYQNQYQNSHEQSKQEALTQDNFQLRRVKSLRIQQQDKISLFLKKQSMINIQIQPMQEQVDEPQRIFHSPNKRSTLVLKSQSLSPKKCKSKKIDKFKQIKLI